MRTAIILFGNLRTWLMPTKEDPSQRLCDFFYKNIIANNNVDVFVYTDTNNFYYNDVQYFSTNKKIEISNNNIYNLHDKVDFIDNELARKIIVEEMKVLGNNVKSILVEDLFDATSDCKYKLLYDANVVGNNPELIIHQFRKLKLAYELLKKYERDNNIIYDVIAKWRFDLTAFEKLNFNNYDYKNTDIYVPGDYSPIIYDWHAFGNRRSMDLYLSIYDILGSFLHEGRVYWCSNCRYYGQIKSCHCSTDEKISEITMSSEYHLFKTLNQNNIRIKNSGYLGGIPYRYKDINLKVSIDDIIKKMNANVTITSFSSGREVTDKTYYKNNNE